MRNPFGKIAIGCVLALALMGSAAYAQAPTPTAPKGSVVVASPTYTSIAMEIKSTARRRRCGSVSASTVTSANGFKFRLGARSYRVRTVSLAPSAP